MSKIHISQRAGVELLYGAKTLCGIMYKDLEDNTPVITNQPSMIDDYFEEEYCFNCINHPDCSGNPREVKQTKEQFFRYKELDRSFSSNPDCEHDGCNLEATYSATYWFLAYEDIFHGSHGEAEDCIFLCTEHFEEELKLYDQSLRNATHTTNEEEPDTVCHTCGTGLYGDKAIAVMEKRMDELKAEIDKLRNEVGEMVVQHIRENYKLNVRFNP